MLEYLPIGHGSKDGSSRNSMQVNVLRYVINAHSQGQPFRSRDMNIFCSYCSGTDTANPSISAVIKRLSRSGYIVSEGKGNRGWYRVKKIQAIKTMLCTVERRKGYPESFEMLPSPKRITTPEEREKWKERKKALREERMRERESPAWIRDTSSIMFNLGR